MRLVCIKKLPAEDVRLSTKHLNFTIKFRQSLTNAEGMLKHTSLGMSGRGEDYTVPKQNMPLTAHLRKSQAAL